MARTSLAALGGDVATPSAGGGDVRGGSRGRARRRREARGFADRRARRRRRDAGGSRATTAHRSSATRGGRAHGGLRRLLDFYARRRSRWDARADADAVARAPRVDRTDAGAVVPTSPSRAAWRAPRGRADGDARSISMRPAALERAPHAAHAVATKEACSQAPVSFLCERMERGAREPTVRFARRRSTRVARARSKGTGVPETRRLPRPSATSAKRPVAPLAVAEPVTDGRDGVRRVNTRAARAARAARRRARRGAAAARLCELLCPRGGHRRGGRAARGRRARSSSRRLPTRSVNVSGLIRLAATRGTRRSDAARVRRADCRRSPAGALAPRNAREADSASSSRACGGADLVAGDARRRRDRATRRRRRSGAAARARALRARKKTLASARSCAGARTASCRSGRKQGARFARGGGVDDEEPPSGPPRSPNRRARA